MSHLIICPDCKEPTEVPAFLGERVSRTCGCPTGELMSRVKLGQQDIIRIVKEELRP